MAALVLPGVERSEVLEDRGRPLEADAVLRLERRNLADPGPLRLTWLDLPGDERDPQLGQPPTHSRGVRAPFSLIERQHRPGLPGAARTTPRPATRRAAGTRDAARPPARNPPAPRGGWRGRGTRSAGAGAGGSGAPRAGTAAADALRRRPRAARETRDGSP